MDNAPSSIRQQSHSRLASLGVPVHPNLPLLECLQPRSVQELAKRVVALYCMAGVANGADQSILFNWLKSEGWTDFLERPELDLLHQSAYTDEQLNQMSWMQESIYALCWCGGLIKDLALPQSECDLSDIFSQIPPEVDLSEFVESLQIRNADVVWQELDYYYNLHASLVHPELWTGRKMRSMFILPVVLERRHALEWICAPKRSWVEVSLDT